THSTIYISFILNSFYFTNILCYFFYFFFNSVIVSFLCFYCFSFCNYICLCFGCWRDSPQCFSSCSFSFVYDISFKFICCIFNSISTARYCLFNFFPISDLIDGLLDDGFHGHFQCCLVFCLSIYSRMLVIYPMLSYIFESYFLHLFVYSIRYSFGSFFSCLS